MIDDGTFAGASRLRRLRLRSPDRRPATDGTTPASRADGDSPGSRNGESARTPSAARAATTAARTPGRQRHDPLPVAVGIVLVPEADQPSSKSSKRLLLIATRWVYRARYFNTCFGAAEGRLGIDHPVGADGCRHQRSNSTLPDQGRPRSGARPRRTPRGARPGTCRGTPGSGPAPAGRSCGREPTQRVPSGDNPPPGTTQWTCGWN